MGRRKLTNAAKIRSYFTKNPNATPAECIAALGVKPANVYLERSKMKQKLTKVSDTPNSVVEVKVDKALDLVNHPPHYKSGGIETIDFIEAKGLGYHLGNVVKYISRAGLKGTNMGMEDLKKARWYLDRAIEKNEIAKPSA